MSPGPCGHVQGVDHQSGGHRAGGLASDEAPRVDVDDEGHVDDPRPRRAVGEVGHPQGVGARGREVSIDEVRRPHGGGVGLGGEPLLRPARPPDAVGGHEPCHLVPTGTDAGPGGGLGELAASVDRVVVLPELGESRSELGVTDGPGRRWPGQGVVVRGWGDLQLCADRLDPPSTPTGLASR